jgi:hypothetical protein
LPSYAGQLWRRFPGNMRPSRELVKTVDSVYDIVDVKLAPPGHVALAALCAQRAIVVWQPVDDMNDLGSRIVAGLDLVFDALKDVPRSVVASVQETYDVLVEELHPDCDFGRLHGARLNALVAVVAAAGAVLAIGDEASVVELAVEAAGSEIAIVKGTFHDRTGTYDGVNDDVSVARALRWQVEDFEALSRPDWLTNIGQLRGRARGNGPLLLTDVERDDW